MMKIPIKCSILFCSLIIFVGCATIPPEAPLLSQELGNRISTLESANLNLLHNYFDLKRNAIDEFIQDEWLPVFIEEFYSNKKIQEILEEVLASDDSTDRLKFSQMTSSKIQIKINEKRSDFIQPLDDLERDIQNKIIQEYALAKSINNTLTSFLQSASNVAENRDRYLEMIGITDNHISEILNNTDEAIDYLLQSKGDIEEKISSGREYLKKLENIKKSL